MNRLFKNAFAVAVLMWTTATLATAQTVVYSNNPAPGDDVTYSGTGAAVPVGSSGWIYNNVRYDGHVGIRTDIPDNHGGNGSVWFKGEQGPLGNSSKADIEYWSTTPLGKLSDLESLSYEWYRKSGSYTATNFIHPSLRVWITDGNKWGYLVFERVYNVGPVAAPTDTWVPETISDTTILWSTGTLPDAFAVYNRTLAQWKSLLGSNYYVYAISSGIGSGWGTFEGAVDYISYKFTGGQLVTTNFEVVPEPGTMALFGLGLAAVGGLIRRRKA